RASNLHRPRRRGGVAMMTIVTRVKLKEGSEPRWDAAMRERLEAARSQPGWIAGQVAIPVDALDERVIIGTWQTRRLGSVACRSEVPRDAATAGWARSQAGRRVVARGHDRPARRRVTLRPRFAAPSAFRTLPAPAVRRWRSAPFCRSRNSG